MFLEPRLAITHQAGHKICQDTTPVFIFPCSGSSFNFPTIQQLGLAYPYDLHDLWIGCVMPAHTYTYRPHHRCSASKSRPSSFGWFPRHKHQALYAGLFLPNREGDIKHLLSYVQVGWMATKQAFLLRWRVFNSTLLAYHDTVLTQYLRRANGHLRYPTREDLHLSVTL